MLFLFADFVLAIQGQQFLLMYLLLLFPLYLTSSRCFL
nr:MAG TPA: hypothetical protein [Caudoviricetes sp.]DAZ73051.1 MAG TPA: hypothetical protein [Caudoviricetes sp.]